MAVFAVLREENEFVVRHAHINIWVLGGIFSHSTFLFDVGLRLKAGATPLGAFGLALPFKTDKAGISDLIDKLGNQKTLELIFGKPLPTPVGDRINYDGEEVSLRRINPAAVEAKDPGDSFSVWKIPLSHPLPAGEQCYVRLRVGPANLGRMWQWKRRLLIKHRAQLDFRVADRREAWRFAEAPAHLDRCVPIGEEAPPEVNAAPQGRSTPKRPSSVNVFLIAAASFQPETAHPPVHYMRLLEGGAWEEYLGRRPHFRSSVKMLIFQWRSPEGEVVGVEKPFRAFAIIRRDIGYLSAGGYVALAIVVVAASVTWHPVSLATLQPGWEGVIGWFRAHPLQGGLLGALVLLLVWIPRVKTIGGWLAALRKQCLKAEAFLLGKTR